MTKDFILKKILPHIIIILLFLALVVTFFKPVFFEKKELVQNDIFQYMGMSKELVDFRNQTGEEPLWTNAMFSGMPAFQISTMYPSNFFSRIHDFFRTLLPGPASIVFFGLLSFYLLLLLLNVDFKIAAAGAFAYAFSTNTLVYLEAGHNSKAMAISVMPLVIAGVYYAFNKNRIWGAIITANALALELACNHLQITYYLILVVLVYGTSELLFAYKNKNLNTYFKTLSLLMIAAILAGCTSAGNLMTTFSYSKYTIRGESELNINEKIKSGGLDKDYAYAWSNAPSESFTLMIPNYKGGASRRIMEEKSTFKSLKVKYKDIVGQMDSYWGILPFTSGPVYIGCILCFLFVMGIFTVKTPFKWGMVMITFIAIALSWGKNFQGLSDLFFDYFPGYNKFRAVIMILVIVQVCVPILGLIALDNCIKNLLPAKDFIKKLMISFSLTGGLCLLFYLLPTLFNEFFKEDEINSLTKLLTDNKFPQNEIPVFLDSLEDARIQIFRGDAIRSFFLIGLTGALLYLYAKKKIISGLVIAGVAVLFFIDLWMVDKRYMNEDNFQKKVAENYFKPTLADQIILQDTSVFRVLNMANPFNDARTSYFHKSIGGYHGAKLRRYQDLIEKHISKNNMNVINMLNTKYFIMGDDEKNPVRINQGAAGNAWFVNAIKKVNSADEEILSLQDFEPHKTGVVDISKFPVSQTEFKTDSLSHITLVKYLSNDIVYQSRNSQAGFGVFSEIYYEEGWKAFMDDKPAEHIRVNYVLRGMNIPAGKHKIEFKFQPDVYYSGERISLISSLIILLSGAGWGWVWVKRKRFQI